MSEKVKPLFHKSCGWIGTLFFDEMKVDEMLHRIAEISQLGGSNSTILRWCGQVELCPKTHRLHMHIFVEFKQEWTRTKARHIFGQGHWENAIDKELCIDYATKLETRVAGPFGSNNVQGLVFKQRLGPIWQDVIYYPPLPVSKIELLKRISEILN